MGQQREGGRETQLCEESWGGKATAVGVPRSGN
jgi:hypothetical protein